MLPFLSQHGTGSNHGFQFLQQTADTGEYTTQR